MIKGGKFITASKLGRLTVVVTVAVTTLLLLLFWLGFESFFGEDDGDEWRTV